MAALNLSFAHVIFRGTRPPRSIKAAVSDWLGRTIELTDHGFWSQWFGASNFTGKAVRVDDALKLSTVWACVRLLAETLATLPLGFYRRQSDGSRDPATTHNLYNLLHSQPNADMTAAAFWQVVIASMLLWGNAFVEIRRTAGVVSALNFLLPHRMNVRRLDSGGLEYRYVGETGGERLIPAASMMHIPAFSLDGIMGLSAVQFGANVFGTAIDTDRASAETFAQANRATGIVTGVQKGITAPQRELLRGHIKHVSETGGVYVLEAGTGYESLKFNPHDAELLQSRSWNVEEICRWFGLDPAIVGHGGKDSNWGTGLEQKMLWFISLALRKWCVRIEQAIRKSLLTPTERQTYFAEWNLEGLLRGDSASRGTWYSTMAQNGLKTRNEIRRLENDPPMPGGDVLTVQSNLLPLDQLGKQPAAADTAARDAFVAWLGIQPSAKDE